jgi:hypothetical protein
VIIDRLIEENNITGEETKNEAIDGGTREGTGGEDGPHLETCPDDAKEVDLPEDKGPNKESKRSSPDERIVESQSCQESKGHEMPLDDPMEGLQGMEPRTLLDVSFGGFLKSFSDCGLVSILLGLEHIAECVVMDIAETI